MVEPWEL
jgi:hypothetical protein